MKLNESDINRIVGDVLNEVWQAPGKGFGSGVTRNIYGQKIDGNGKKTTEFVPKNAKEAFAEIKKIGGGSWKKKAQGKWSQEKINAVSKIIKDYYAKKQQSTPKQTKKEYEPMSEPSVPQNKEEAEELIKSAQGHGFKDVQQAHDLSNWSEETSNEIPNITKYYTDPSYSDNEGFDEEGNMATGMYDDNGNMTYYKNNGNDAVYESVAKIVKEAAIMSLKKLLK